MPRTIRSHRRARWVFGVALTSLVVGSFAWAPPAGAATITVNTFVDELDDPANGTCSLREAVVAANEDTATGGCPAGSGPDTIALAAGTYLLTIPDAGDDVGYADDLDVLDNDGDELDDGGITFQGAGMNATIIDGNGYVTDERVFHVREDDATFLDLTVRNGNGSRGAGIFAHTDGTVTVQRSSVHSNISSTNGGGITATQGATLNVIDSEVSNNTAPFSGFGGGIYVSEEGEELTIQNSTISDNMAFLAGGGITVLGGVPMLIENSIVSGNATRDSEGGGGGMFIQPPFLLVRTEGETQPPFSSLIIDSTVNENSSAGAGGGILIDCCGFTEIVESTISNNTAAFHGGGIFNAAAAGGETRMENVTVSSNSADQDGGGIYNGDGSDLYMNHTTVYRNEASTAGTGGGIFDDTAPPPPPRDDDEGTVHYENSIIAKNTYEDCGGSGVGPVSDGYNLLGDHSCDSSGPGDVEPVNSHLDPGLAPLRDNGDTESPHERTHELLPGSPAIDLVDGLEEDCPPPATDQRGLTRPTGGACDAGAYEVGSLEQAPGPDVGGEVVTKPALCRKQNPTILGTLGPDRLVGTNGPDIIQGLDARDVILGKGGDDIICGSLGNDLLKGQGGDDWTKGLRGDDTDRGGPGTDKCVRGPGEDEYFSCENIPNN